MKILTVYSRYRELIAISGMWKVVNITKFRKFTPDAFVVVSGEPILGLECDYYDIMKIVNILQEYISISTLISRCRQILGFDKKIFILDRALELEKLNDLVRACYCGSIDGIVLTYLKNINLNDNTANIIDTLSEDRQYIFIDLKDVEKLSIEEVRKCFGIIVNLNIKPSESVVQYLRDRIYLKYGKSRIVISIPHIYATPKLLSSVKKYINGICLSSVGKDVFIDVIDVDRDIQVYRCVNCRKDYITSSKIKKCAVCNEKLVEIFRDFEERYFRYSCRELKYIFLNNLKNVFEGINVEYLE